MCRGELAPRLSLDNDGGVVTQGGFWGWFLRLEQLKTTLTNASARANQLK